MCVQSIKTKIAIATVFAISTILLFAGYTYAADCSLPARPEGSFIYNKNYQVLQYCNGTEWVGAHGVSNSGNRDVVWDCPGSDGLVGYWKFDESSGTTAYDSVGSNDGETNGGATWQPYGGIIGGAIQFDEVNDYVQIPDFNYLTPYNEYSIAFWFKLTDNAGSEFQYILSHGEVSTVRSINLYCAEESRGTDPNALISSLKDSSGSPSDNGIMPGACSDTAWHHVVIQSWNNSKFKTLYLDGSTALYWYDPGSGTTNPSTDIFVGGREDLNSQRFFGGLIDDFRIYNRILGSGEIASLYFAREGCSL